MHTGRDFTEALKRQNYHSGTKAKQMQTNVLNYIYRQCNNKYIKAIGLIRLLLECSFIVYDMQKSFQMRCISSYSQLLAYSLIGTLSLTTESYAYVVLLELLFHKNRKEAKRTSTIF